MKKTVITMRNVATVEELKELALKIKSFIELESAYSDKMWIYKIPTYTEDDEKIVEGRTYATHNGVMCFHDGTHTLYVIPATPRIWQLLKVNGFTEKYTYIPFAHGETPHNKEERMHWNDLLHQADMIHAEQYRKTNRVHAMA